MNTIVLICLVIYKLYKLNYFNIYRITELINAFFSYFCHDPSVLNVSDFPWTQDFKDNWKTIRDEYIAYSSQYQIPKYSQLNQVVSTCDSENKWQALFLRTFNQDTELVKFFPETMKLINSCPCTLAFFSVLPPKTRLSPHVGVYKGVIRYHLGLIVPKESDKCFLNIDGHVLNWHEGKDLMFDDMFVHSAENNSDETRVVLFLDIQRDFHNPILAQDQMILQSVRWTLNTLNSLCLRFIKSNDAVTETVNNVNKFAAT